MVSQDIQDLIFNVVDANNEYNTKIIILCIFFVYLVFSLWFANRIIPFNATRDQTSEFPIYKQISVKLMRVGATIFLVFYPLIIGIFLYREYDIDSLISLLVTGYSVMTMIGLGIWFLFGMHWVQELLALIGVDTGSSKKGRIIRRRE